MRTRFTLSRRLLPVLLGLSLGGCGETPPERLKAGDALYAYSVKAATNARDWALCWSSCR